MSSESVSNSSILPTHNNVGDGTTLTARHYRTSNPYESKYGYARGTRRGPFIFISGTTSTHCPPPSSSSISHSENSRPQILHPESAYLQTIHILNTIITSVKALGGTREDITRVRMFVNDEKDCDEVGRGLKEVLGDDVGPAATMIVGVGFVSKDMKVEIEADAVVV